MALTLHTFTVYDVTHFPLVVMRNEAIAPGYAVQWEKELEALLHHAQPFVILFPPGRPEAEDHEDRKRRMQWFKANRERLSAVCRALISIEADEEERESLRARAADLVKVFGVPLEIAMSWEEAQALGARLTLCVD